MWLSGLGHKMQFDTLYTVVLRIAVLADMVYMACVDSRVAG